MTPDRWQRLRSLYDVALDHAPSERMKAISSRAGVDSDLVDEVIKLLEQDEAAGDFLEESPAKQLREELHSARPIFQPGDCVAQRFTVVRLIGSGGMGEVYEAEDSDLGERVALKTVRVDRLTDPKAHHRLRREALLARKITHPNVCRIFDILRHQGGQSECAVLTMELLQGETLAQHLHTHASLEPTEAEPIIRQMLAALGAAHQAGVIHRDFKPSNVMLVDGRAVVTDFGLAIIGSNSSGEPVAGTTLTHSGQLIGTPEYMSPEQIRNQAVTPRSDIYSLGVVIYEMFTGQRPTQGATGLEEVLNRVLDAPPSPRKLNPGLSRRWETVIMRCLERDPERRFDNTHEVLRALDGGIRSLSLPRISRRTAWTTVAAAATVTASGAAYAVWRQQNQLPVNPLIVVAPLTGAQGQLSSTGLLLFRQLEQSSHIRLWSLSGFPEAALSLRLEKLKPADLSAEQWRSVSHRVHANYVVHTTISPIAGEYVLNCTVEKLGDATPAALRQWDKAFRFSSLARSLDAVRDAANWIRSTVGETPEAIASRDRAPGLLTTGSPEALSLFEQAEEIRDTRTAEAVSLLREAVRIDPDFAIAWMRLGDLQVTLTDWPNGIASWQRASNLADSGHLSQREADRIRTMYAVEIGEVQTAEAAAIRWSQDFPEELRPLWEIFHSRMEMGRIADAEKIIPQMSALPNSQRYYCLADALVSIWTGETERMQKSALNLKAAGAESQGQKLFSCSFALQGNMDRALTEAHKLLQLPAKGQVSSAYVYIAALEAARAKLDDAGRWLKDGLHHDQAQGILANEPIKRLGLAYLAWLQNRFDEVRTQTTLAMQTGDPVTMIPQCVALLCRSGHQALALAARSRWTSPLRSRRFDQMEHGMKGEILLGDSKSSPAMDAIRLATTLQSKLRPPEPLLHGLSASGQKSAAREFAKSLIEKPAVLWYSAEYVPVGTIYYCRQDF